MKNSTEKLLEVTEKTPLRVVSFTQGDSLNEIFLQKGSEGIMEIISGGQAKVTAKEEVAKKDVIETKQEMVSASWEEQKVNESDSDESCAIRQATGELICISENKLTLRMEENEYSVLGNLTQDISSMQITLMVEEIASGVKERIKIDLYERDVMRNFSLELAELFSQNPQKIEADFLLLTDELEKYREKQSDAAKPNYQNKRSYASISPENHRKCVEFLSKPDLINNIDELIGQSGVVGEDGTRKLLFVIASTYKMSHPLHSLVQGTSGSGKSHLINSIANCFPPEDVLSMTRVTSKSFYHYNKDELVDKLILIQDYDGLDEEAQYAFRELQSAGNITSSTIYKDRNGNLVSGIKTVRSHFASLLATTRAEVYHDNMSRSMIIGVDESESQTKKIIEYQNKKLSGGIDSREEKNAREFLQNCMRCIKPIDVVNRYADQVFLPTQAKMLRRLNSHYQSFVKQIAILHQFQREKDEQGRLIAEPQDLKMACDILLEAIMLKVDDLDSSLRNFFEGMKEFIKVQSKGKQFEYLFTQRDVRLALNMSKTQCFRYMEDLELLEYVQRVGGYANRGFKYKIVFWDDMEKVRTKVKEELNRQLILIDNAA